MRISALAIATFAGFLGGTIGSHLATVHAQGPGVEILQSKSFVLWDGAGRERGEWKMDPSGQPMLRLFDAQGRVIWDTAGTARPRHISLDGACFTPPSKTPSDWSAPLATPAKHRPAPPPAGRRWPPRAR